MIFNQFPVERYPNDHGDKKNKINNSISKENTSLCVKRHRTLKEFTVKAFHGHFHQFSIGKDNLCYIK